MLLIGAHVIANGDVIKALRKLKSMGGNVLQLFLSNPCSVRKVDAVNWSEKQIKDVRNWCEKVGVVLVVHSKYLLNLSRRVDGRNMWALRSLIDDMIVAEKIGAIGCVIHMGSRGGEMTIKQAERGMVNSIKYVLADKDVKGGKCKVILETSSAEGTKIGGNLDEMTSLWKSFGVGMRKKLGVCVDTAHIFAGGHDIHKVNGLKKYFKEFDKKIGLQYLDVIHLNDSAREFNSHIDKHDGIGKGYIFGKNKGGNGEIGDLLRVADKHNIPIILETHDDYKKEIKMLRGLSKNLGLNLGLKGGGNNDMLVRKFERLRDFHHSFGANHIHEYNAYRKIVDILKKYPKQIRDIENVKGVDGIGKRTIEKIEEILKTGELKMLKDIEKDKRLVGKMHLQTVMGIGPSKAGDLVRKGIYSVSDLKRAVKRGDVKLNDKQLVALKYSSDLDKRIPRNEVKKFGNVVNNVAGKLGCHVELAGSYMYGAKDSGDVDMIVICKNLVTKTDVMKRGENVMQNLIDRLVDDGVIIEILDMGKSKFMGLGRLGKHGKVRHIDIRLASMDAVDAFKLYFGSGADFSRWIRGVARDKGYKLNEWGLEDRRTGKRIDNGTERSIFKVLGVDYIEPKNRK